MHTELDAKIREWEKKIRNQHKNMGGVHMSSQHTVQTQKTIRTLENRLDQVRNLLLNSLIYMYSIDQFWCTQIVWWRFIANTYICIFVNLND